MTLALWMLLAAGLLPYATVVYAKRPGGHYDNAQPREWARTLGGSRQRAYAAHQNHFEFFPLFAVAVLIADWKSGGSTAVNLLATGIVASRILYTLAYIRNRPGWRSLFWGVAMLGILALFGMAARA